MWWALIQMRATHWLWCANPLILSTSNFLLMERFINAILFVIPHIHFFNHVFNFTRWKWEEKNVRYPLGGWGLHWCYAGGGKGTLYIMPLQDVLDLSTTLGKHSRVCFDAQGQLQIAWLRHTHIQERIWVWNSSIGLLLWGVS